MGKPTHTVVELVAFWKGVFDPNIERVDDQRRLGPGQTNWKIADPITVHELNSVLKVMAQSTSGPVGVTFKDFRKASPGLIVAVLNGLVFHGLAPEELTLSRTTLIPKGPNPGSPGDYSFQNPNSKPYFHAVQYPD